MAAGDLPCICIFALLLAAVELVTGLLLVAKGGLTIEGLRLA